MACTFAHPEGIATRVPNLDPLHRDSLGMPNDDGGVLQICRGLPSREMERLHSADERGSER